MTARKVQMITVHEPLSIRGDVGLLDAEIQVGEDLHGLEKDSMFSTAVDLENEKNVRREREKKLLFFPANLGFLRCHLP